MNMKKSRIWAALDNKVGEVKEENGDNESLNR